MESLNAFPLARHAITFSNIAFCVIFFIFTEGSMNDSGSRLLLLSAVYIRMYFGRSRVFAAWVSGQARKSRQIRWLVQSVALGPRAKRGQLDATVDTRLIHLHDGVQVDLEVHGWEDGERIVNPVVLVIARDTMHAARTVVLIESNRRSRAVARTIYPR